MGIVGPRPESGMRIDLLRPARGGPPWRYEGEVVTPENRFALRADVTESGEVRIDASGDLPEGTASRARLLLRAACKHAKADDAAPPRRIVRWRP
jgi:hypothetical protein